MFSAWLLRSATRERNPADYRNDIMGFRVAQYDAADPENRLVADELERRWNQALQRVCEVELRIEQHVHHHGNFAAARTREQFEDLASELEAVWSCSETDVRLKKRILRALIHEIIVDVDAECGRDHSHPSLEGRRAHRTIGLYAINSQSQRLVGQESRFLEILAN